jgi:ketosteroid isomerase-like protein
MMTSEQREGYERRRKYIPMKPKDVARLSPEDREEYEDSLR